MTSFAELRRQVETIYRQRTSKSAELANQAQQVMPGGETRVSTFFSPYPVVIERAEGRHLYDVDGNELLDFLNNYTSLVHGHAFPPIIEAARQQLERGTAWAAANVPQIKLASLMCERVASVERIRFTNSGTEATMLAIRAARAFTGRDLIIKIEGGYHGTHETVGVSISPDITQAGPAETPVSVPAGPGISSGALQATRIVPFNNSTALEQMIGEKRDKIAAIILEPVMG